MWKYADTVEVSVNQIQIILTVVNYIISPQFSLSVRFLAKTFVTRRKETFTQTI